MTNNNRTRHRIETVQGRRPIPKKIDDNCTSSSPKERKRYKTAKLAHHHTYTIVPIMLPAAAYIICSQDRRNNNMIRLVKDKSVDYTRLLCFTLSMLNVGFDTIPDDGISVRLCVDDKSRDRTDLYLVIFPSPSMEEKHQELFYKFGMTVSRKLIAHVQHIVDTERNEEEDRRHRLLHGAHLKMAGAKRVG